MVSIQSRNADEAPTFPQGRFSFVKLTICLVGSLLIGAFTAWTADGVQHELHFAPLLIFPLFVGVLSGMAMIGLVRAGQIGHRPTILWGTVLMATTAVVGQHYQVYRAAVASPEKFDQSPRMRRELDEGRLPVAARPPESFLGFLESQAEVGRPLAGSLVVRGPMAWATWALDGVLLLAAAVAVVYPITRLPYCNKCGTWFRTIRSGRMDAEGVRAVAELADLKPETEPKSGRFRLSCCEGGCGVSSLVVLWEDAAGATFTGEAALEPDARNRVMEIADSARSAAEEPEDEKT